MATYKIDDDWMSDTITISSGATGTDTLLGSGGSPSYSIDYGAIPALSTVDLGSMTNSTISAVGGVTGGPYTIGSGTAGGTFQWPNTVWTTNTTNITASPVIMNQSGKISLQGDNADIDINGKSMRAWMEQVEERLNILTPNPELEKEWDELRRLGERYRKLEKKCKEKAEVWKKLKAMPPPQVG